LRFDIVLPVILFKWCRHVNVCGKCVRLGVKIAQRNLFLKNKTTIVYIHDIYRKFKSNISIILKTKHPHRQNTSKIQSTTQTKSRSVTKTMYISWHLY
jgi:hypothetical protein